MIVFGLWETDKYPVLLVRDVFVKAHVVEELCEIGMDCLPFGVVAFRAYPVNSRALRRVPACSALISSSDVIICSRHSAYVVGHTGRTWFRIVRDCVSTIMGPNL